MNETNGKILKLSFAMGGGVSLGAFSGAALTEALKLLLTDGVDENGRRYDRIELDSMSGASAGAVSLCIMLSSLLNYKRYLSDKSIIPPNKFSLKDIDKSLAKQFGDNWIKKYKEKNIVESLRAIQVAQELQKVLWVDKLNMHDLIRLEEFDINQKENFSLLDRSLLIELINEYILSDIEQLEEKGESQSQIISKDRFLFACSLTNLIPLQLGTPYSEKTEPLVRELQKAHASYNHKELRLFDFQLNRDTADERSRLTKAIKIGRNDSFEYRIDRADTWSMITSTCLACAAFPFAFEPVVLKRFQYEFKIDHSEGITSVEEMKTMDDFQEAVKKSNFKVHQSKYNESYNKNIEEGHPWKLRRMKINRHSSELQMIEYQHPTAFFSYIDGGTLNNEPIREAFRMANYLDARDPAPKESYDRIIIFVDPIVRTEPVKHNSPSFYEYHVSHKKNNTKIRYTTEIDRLTAYTNKLVTTLRDQGSIKEEHKISTYLSSIHLHEKLIELINKSDFSGEFTQDFTQTVQTFLLYQVQQNNDDHISTFDINDRQFVEVLVRNYLIDNNIEFETESVLYYLYKMLSIIRDDQDKDASLETTTARLNEQIDLLFRPTIKKLFYRKIIQAVLDADGKDPSAMRMAITPVLYDTDVNGKEHLSTIELPGSEFQAFGGFASQMARNFSNEYGRYCAYRALSRNDFRKYYSRVMNLPNFSNVSMLSYKKSVEKYYTNQLDSLSPLHGKFKSHQYWMEVRKNIFSLMKKRLGKSLIPYLTSRNIIYGIIFLLFSIGMPWIIDHYIGFGVLIQSILIVLVFVLGYLYNNMRIRNSIRHSFYHHQLPSLKMAIIWKGVKKNVTHIKLREHGSYIKGLRQFNRCIVPLPYIIGYVPKLSPTPGLFFIQKPIIPKRFESMFSISSLDLTPQDEASQISFYRKRNRLSSPKLLFSIDIKELYKIEDIMHFEKYISPILICELENGKIKKIELTDEATPLEESILNYYNKNKHLI